METKISILSLLLIIATISSIFFSLLSFVQSSATNSLGSMNSSISESSNMTLNVKRFAIFSPLTIESTTMQISGNFKVSGQLYDFLTQAPISNAKIIFLAFPPLNPTPILITATTDAYGQFETIMTPPILSGTYYIKTHFEGNSKYYPADSFPVMIYYATILNPHS
ncbi:MAG TPA: hypothetical protein VFV86_02710 [Nitrososphaeraceae archaeon]|nr:hypothetical protein [Nitrososphaeraceae archaeon]